MGQGFGWRGGRKRQLPNGGAHEGYRKASGSHLLFDALCAGRPLSLEGVSQMDSILPERLLALVRPGNDLVLRRTRSLKRCVQACGCKIMTPRYEGKMPSSCVSARRAKKIGKKKSQPESQPGAKPNQPESQPESQPQAKPNQKPSQSQKPSQTRPESQSGANQNQPEANQNQPEPKPARKPTRSQAKASQGFLSLRGLALQKQRQLLGILPDLSRATSRRSWTSLFRGRFPNGFYST